MDFDKIAEDKIREAIEKGEFDNLPGRGKPLRGLAEYFATPEGVRIGYSVLKGSGFVPEEVTLLKEIESLRARLKACSQERDKSKTQAEIQQLQLKYDLIMDSYRRGRRTSGS